MDNELRNGLCNLTVTVSSMKIIKFISCVRFFFFFHCSYFPSDPPYVTDDLRNKGAYKDALQTLRSELEQLQKYLSKSVPFYSSRYKVTLFRIEYCKAETTFRRVTTRKKN